MAEIVSLAAASVVVTKPRYSFEWTLHGLRESSFVLVKLGEKLCSPPFAACGFDWRLEVFLNGYVPANKASVCAQLWLLSSDVTSPEIRFAFSLVANTASSKSIYELGRFSSLNACSFGRGKLNSLCSHDALLAQQMGFNGELKFRVEMQVMGIDVRAPSTAEAAAEARTIPQPSLTADLAALLSSAADSDVTLCCSGGEEFRAHSFVLRLRSPFFGGALCWPSDATTPDASTPKTLAVPEAVTPHTLRRVLDFLYTDKLEPASPEEATHLLHAADLFELPRLLAIASSSLLASLSVDMAANTLVLAAQHGLVALRAASMRFIAKHAVAVMKTAGWAHLKAAAPELADEVMYTLATGSPPKPQHARAGRLVELAAEGDGVAGPQKV